VSTVPLDLFEQVRALVALDPARLDTTTAANPGRFATVEGMLVVDKRGVLWVVGHHSAERLDRLLWQAFHVDPDEAILGRLRVTVGALP
jgi:hypothetical protein